MSMLTALLLLAQPSPTSAMPPGRPLLDAFDAACARTADIGHATQDALGSGWEPIEEGSEPLLRHVVPPPRRTENGIVLDRKVFSLFRRTVDGQRLFLFVTRWESADRRWQNDCRLYQFGGPPIDRGSLREWLGREPRWVFDAPALMLGTVDRWEGVLLTINYVAAGTTPSARQLSANFLVAHVRGGF